MKLSVVSALLFILIMESSGTPATVELPRFGRVNVFKTVADPKGVVILLADKAAWKREAGTVTRTLTDEKFMVVGLETGEYFNHLEHRDKPCVWPAVELETLSRAIEKSERLKSYLRPILGGVGDGAEIAYAAAVSASPGVFAGLVTIDFCPKFHVPIQLCKNEKHVWEPGPGNSDSFVFNKEMDIEWRAFSGGKNASCTDKEVAAFADQFPRSVFIGPGAAKQPRFGEIRTGFLQVNDQSPEGGRLSAEVKDLPLIELPARQPTGPLVVLFSGDGGWAGLDRRLAAHLQQRGAPTLGVDSLRYFWQFKTPERASHDLARVLRHYMSTWDRSSAIVIGWSWGADVLPFLINRLPDDLKGKIQATVLIGPSQYATFEFHFTDWLSRWRTEKAGNPVLPEVLRIRHLCKVIAVCGENDRDSLCTQLRDRNVDSVTVEIMGKGHEFSGERSELPARITELLGIK